ncbi:hypothetical protein EBS80_01690, partial [bacterium]|nr:hypothetical protein [bacterium]
MRFLKRLFRAFVAASVAATLMALAYAGMLVHDGYRFFLDQPTHGSVLGDVGGVAVYAGDGYDVRGEYGLEYQCVELVNRALVQKHGFRNLAKTGDADTYFWDA